MRRPRSFRREEGGLYAAYVAIYSLAYRARMRSLHQRGRHGALMANGRCQWCGKPAGPAKLLPEDRPGQALSTQGGVT
jgi:hypothetical protein